MLAPFLLCLTLVTVAFAQDKKPEAVSPTGTTVVSGRAVRGDRLMVPRHFRLRWVKRYSSREQASHYRRAIGRKSSFDSRSAVENGTNDPTNANPTQSFYPQITQIHNQ